MPKNSLNVSLKGADDIFSTEESRQEQQKSEVHKATDDHSDQKPGKYGENTGHARSVPGAAGEEVVVLLDLSCLEERHYFFQRGVG